MVKKFIKQATLADEDLLLEWVNSDDSLGWKKVSKRLISKCEHREWFNYSLSDKHTKIWIIMNDDEPSGQVRLQKKGDLIHIDIYVIADARGLGLASFALDQAITDYTELFGIGTFCAIVNAKNKMSERLFLKNGFYKDYSSQGDWLKFLRVVE